MIWFRRFHKWIALVIGIQIALWMLSGFMMGLLDHEQVLGITISEYLPNVLCSQNLAP